MPEPTPEYSGERFSRAAAVKLAVAGMASFGLAQWTTPSWARGSDFADCVEDCSAGIDAWYFRQIDARDRFFLGNFRGANSAEWKKLVRRVIFPAPQMILNYWWIVSGETALVIAHKAEERCPAECRKKCASPRSRSAQSRSGKGQACKAPPPPKPYTPAMPPAPNPADDPCSACTQVGGLCCGPFKAGADGRFLPCACANPSLGCERYGCG